MYVTTIVMAITEKFLVRAWVSNREWRFDQEQCRKSVDQGGTGEGKMPGASEGTTCVTQGMARYKGNGKGPGHPQGGGPRWRHPSDRQEQRT